MMSEDEDALRKVVYDFRGDIPNIDRFVAELLDLKQAHHSEVKRFSKNALRPSDAIKTIVALLHKLDDAEVIFRRLQAHSPLSKERHPMQIINTPTELKFGRTRSGMLEALSHDNTFLGWFPEVLEAMRASLKDEVYGLVNSQQTVKKLQEISFVMLGYYCHKAGIKYAYSKRSKFYKLALWLSGLEDPKRALMNAKRLYLRAMNEWTIVS